MADAICTNSSFDIPRDSFTVLLFVAFWATADRAVSILVNRITPTFSTTKANRNPKKGPSEKKPAAPQDDHGVASKEEQTIHQRHKQGDASTSDGSGAHVNEISAPAENPVTDNKVNPAIPTDEQQSISMKRRKFQRSFWKAINYLTLFIVGYVILSKEEWAYNRWIYFDDLPHPVPDSIRIYYLLETAHYVYATLIIKSEPKQSDLWQMILHHFATLVLLLWSYCLSYYRIGTMVLILMDISDPFLEIAKLMKYLGLQTIADYLFTIFAVVFLATRLVIYPFFIMYPAWLSINVSSGIWLNFWLFVLYIIFIFWSYIILDIAVKLAMGSGVTDTREEE